jgi:hypothetical protein
MELGLRVSHRSLRDEQSGLLTHTAMMGSVSVVRANEKLSAFVEPQANGRRAWPHQRDKARFA